MLTGPWQVILSIGIVLFYPPSLLLDYYAEHRTRSPYWRHAARTPFALISMSFLLFILIYYMHSNLDLFILPFYALLGTEAELLCQVSLKPKLAARFPEKT